MLFPGKKKSIFVGPKQISVVLKSEKQKTNEKKNKTKQNKPKLSKTKQNKTKQKQKQNRSTSANFLTFHPSFFNFPTFFPIFPFFFASFFPAGQQKFLDQKSPAPAPACCATEKRHKNSFGTYLTYINT